MEGMKMITATMTELAAIEEMNEGLVRPLNQA